MKPRVLLFSSILVYGVASLTAATDGLTLKSPDGRRSVSFNKPGKELQYSVSIDGKEVILPSRAGLEIDNRTWEMALGKRDLVQPDSWMDLLTVDSVS